MAVLVLLLVAGLVLMVGFKLLVGLVILPFKVLGLVIILFSVVTWIGVQQLGYADLGALQWMVRHGFVDRGGRPATAPLPTALVAEPVRAGNDVSGSREEGSPAGALAAGPLPKAAE